MLNFKFCFEGVADEMVQGASQGTQDDDDDDDDDNSKDEPCL
jgi:hypothetical protein